LCLDPRRSAIVAPLETVFVEEHEAAASKIDDVADGERHGLRGPPPVDVGAVRRSEVRDGPARTRAREPGVMPGDEWMIDREIVVRSSADEQRSRRVAANAGKGGGSRHGMSSVNGLTMRRATAPTDRRWLAADR